jgi:DNA-binding winged helix-turn-helix (wHTH) protein/tetratricopeptide (TPR) repeat protein
LQPKVLRLLFHLVAHRQRSVSNQELLATLWPGEMVTLASVRRAVAGARRVLGESGDCQLSIQTVRDHGYRFVLSVRELDEGVAAAEPGGRAAQPQARPAPSVSYVRAEAPPAPTDPDIAFVGREGGLAVLDAALREALSRHGRCLWIYGEPGIGKTRMLQELSRRSRARGAQAWLGRCMEVEGAPPLWPLIQMLREAAAQLGPSALYEAMGAGAVDIAHAVPELRQWLPRLPEAPEVDPLRARFLSFDALARFLERASEQQPLVLLFDDLQRADASTLRLIAFLVQQLHGARVLIAATLRSGAATDELRDELLAEIAGHASARPIELAGLSRAELARYVELRAGAAAPEPVIARLHEQTGGNPLFLEQILHEPSGVPAECRWLRLWEAPLAHGLRGAIERHLAGIPPRCRRLLQVAAVIGREFALGALARMVERSTEYVLEQLSAAIDAGLVCAVEDAIGQRRFSHALIRDALYEQLPATTRARLHGRAGLALEAAGAAATEAALPQLAEHFVRAAPGHDGGRALSYLIRSARAARAQLAYEAAVTHFDRALALIELGVGGRVERMALLVEKGEALTCIPDAIAARDTLLEAVAIGEQLGSSLGIVRAAILFGRFIESGTVDPVQVDLIERALALLPPDDPQRTCLLALLAKALSFSREPAATTRAALEVVEATRKLSDPGQRGEALQNCLHALSGADCLRQRLEITAELERIGHEHGSGRALAAAASGRIWTNLELGDVPGVDAALEGLRVIAEHERDPFVRWHVMVFHAMRELIDGRLEASARLASAALALGTKLGEVAAHHVYCVQQSSVLRQQGRIAEAETLVRDVSLRHPAIGGWQVALAGLEADLGRAQRARAVLDRVLERDLDCLRRDPFTLGALAPAADLCARVGDAEQAKLLYKALLPYANRHGVISFGVGTHGPFERHLGHLAIRIGDAAAAEGHLRRALAAAEAMRSPIFISITLLLQAQLLMKGGRPRATERASMCIARAAEIARETGLWGIATHCGALAHALGLRWQVQPQLSGRRAR